MSNYASTDGVKYGRVLLPEHVDELEARYPGVVERLGTKVSGEFDSKLRKRYAAPFEAPYPDALMENVERVVSYRLLMMLRPDSESGMLALAQGEDTKAWAWLAEAADGEKGCVELPRRQGDSGSAIDSGGPLGYAEADPYTWRREQARAVRCG